MTVCCDCAVTVLQVDLTLQNSDTWFFAPDAGYRSLAEMVGIYHDSVGHGGNMLLNVAPPPNSVLPDAAMEECGHGFFWTQNPDPFTFFGFGCCFGVLLMRLNTLIPRGLVVSTAWVLRMPRQPPFVSPLDDARPPLISVWFCFGHWGLIMTAVSVAKKRYAALGKFIAECYGEGADASPTALAATSAHCTNCTKVTLDLGATAPMDRFLIKEELAAGQRVRRFSVTVDGEVHDSSIHGSSCAPLSFNGTAIGRTLIIRLPHPSMPYPWPSGGLQRHGDRSHPHHSAA